MRAQTPSLSLLALVTVILLAVPKETYAQYIDECYYECNIVHCNYYGYCDYDCYEVCYPYRSNSNSSPIKQPRAPPRMQTSSARKNIETSPSSPSSPSYSIIRGNHQPARHQQSSSLTNGAESHIQQVRTGKFDLSVFNLF